jgi:hypothetical protein
VHLGGFALGVELLVAAAGPDRSRVDRLGLDSSNAWIGCRSGRPVRRVDPAVCDRSSSGAPLLGG